MADKITKGADLVEGMVKTIEENSRSEKKFPFDIISGIDELDMILQGFRAGDLLIIASRPSVGKTLFALSICLNMAFQEIECLYVSFEKNENELMKQLLSIQSRIATDNLNVGFLKATDFYFILSNAEKLYKNDFLFLKSVYNISIVALKETIKDAINNHKIKIVFIDYLTMIIPAQLYTNRWEQVSEISRALKTIAVEFGISVVALCPLNRNAVNNPPPYISNLSESGSIEYDADKIIILNENKEKMQNFFEEHQKIVSLIVGKNRNGPIGQFDLLFDYKHSAFNVIKSDKDI